jgi:hypothetical protein
MVYTFAPLGRGQWAVTGKSSQIAEVTVGSAHRAVTPTKGHTVTPSERGGMWAFLYAQGICSKPEGWQRVRVLPLLAAPHYRSAVFNCVTYWHTKLTPMFAVVSDACPVSVSTFHLSPTVKLTVCDRSLHEVVVPIVQVKVVAL